MRKLVILCVVIAMVGGAFLLTGCDSHDDDLVGVWTLEGIPGLESTFNADGTGHHVEDWGFGLTFEWSTSGTRLNWNYPGHARMITPYSISGDVLTLTLDDGEGGEMLFRLYRAS